MREFDYLNPQSILETLQLLEQYGNRAKVLAGGTDLIMQLRKGEGGSDLQVVLNIAHLNELQYICEDGEWIRMGANMTHANIAENELLQKEVPALAEAARTVGSPQIRNRGTIGGNIINASPAADPVPVLIALDAVVTVRSSKGERTLSLADIYLKPYKTNLMPEELLTEVAFKKLPPTARTAFIKLGRRNALAIARMNVAVVVNQNGDGVIDDIRIAPGSTTPTPQRISAAEKILLGQKPSKELIDAAGAKVSEEMIRLSGTRWSTEYKKPVIEALTRRGIRKALEGRS